MEPIGYDGAMVPEPATLALLGSGMAALLAVRRHRRWTRGSPTHPPAATLSRSRHSTPGNAPRTRR
jgi:hypothetical protein